MEKAPDHDGCGALGVDDSDRVHHVGVLKIALLLQRAQLIAAKREREFVHGVAPSFIHGVLVRFAQPGNASASTTGRARVSSRVPVQCSTLRPMTHATIPITSSALTSEKLSPPNVMPYSTVSDAPIPTHTA